MKLIALLDCNNFFASCERLVNPALEGRPVVVLSNNDGCIIARSNEVKALGIKMGVPLFKVKHILEQHRVAICSANFSLYTELSNKVMSALAEIVEELEVYSIDEAFFSFGQSSNKTSENSQVSLAQQAEYVQAYIEKAIGIPVSIGIASTKTLAKLANKIAKDKKLGIFHLESEIDAYLRDTPVADIWGIGWGSQNLFKKHGIYTAYDLKSTKDLWIKQHMNVNGMRTVLELRSIPCFPLDSQRMNEPSRSIISSKSFGTKVKTKEEVKEAVANFISTATRRLRTQKLIATVLHVHLIVCDGPSYRGRSLYASIHLDRPSAETPDFIHAANELIDEIFIPGLAYRKAGVMLTGLKTADTLQLNLFKIEDPAETKQKNISDLVDKINNKLGSNSIFWAAMGTPHQKQAWQSKREWSNTSTMLKSLSNEQVKRNSKTRFCPS